MTRFRGPGRAWLDAFEAACPVSTSEHVDTELGALERLFGRPMPSELRRVLEPAQPGTPMSPVSLAGMSRPFEALIEHARDTGDDAPLLRALTGTVELGDVRGTPMLGHVPGELAAPLVPLSDLDEGYWATDLPTLWGLLEALRSFEAGDVDGALACLEPLWFHVRRTRDTAPMFRELARRGIASALTASIGGAPDPRKRLDPFERHERARFIAHALCGRFEEPRRRPFRSPPVFDDKVDTDLSHALIGLWRGWLLPHEEMLDRALQRTASSRSSLVIDSRRLIEELRAGRRTVGSVDLCQARATHGLWLIDPAARARAQREQRRAALEASGHDSPHGLSLRRARWPTRVQATPPPQPDPMPATWAELPHVRELQSITRLNEYRWLVADRWRLALWDENGEGPSLAHHQRQTRTLPALGVVVAYGDPRLVHGADPEASTAPRVQVFGFDGDLLGLVASFAVDGKELVVEHSDAGLRLGLISVDADVAWALEGLEAAVQQWRDTARARAEAFAAALAAFGELTLDRVVEALRTLLGCAYGPGYQTALDEVFEAVIAPLEADPSWRGAAEAADSPRAFIPTFRGPFATALLEQKRGIAFIEFALRCTTLDPAQSDLVLLAASTSAWLRLRGPGST